jgi:glycosyltransferase involved in cell wall biosynthesis
MNEAPVSVILPTYNRAALVVQSVESVLAAVTNDDEVIVVDDGSTDDTPAALSRFQSSIRYLRVPNRGVGAARNLGVREARHDLVAFNDSDDLWLPDRLQLQRQVMGRWPELGFCFSNFGGLLPDGSHTHDGLGSWQAEFSGDSAAWSETLGRGTLFSELGTLPAGRADFHVYVANFYSAQLELNHVFAVTVLARRSVAGSLLKFPEDISWGEDWECFARLSRAGSAAFLGCETALQRVHSGDRLTAIDRAAKAAISSKILQRVWGADAEFLRQNRSLYVAALARTHVLRARALLTQGNTSEARHELRLAGGGPAAYRALALFPGTWVRGLLAARRHLAGGARTVPAASRPDVQVSTST